MLREQFDRIAEARGYEIQITPEDYKAIETVYMYHPAIGEVNGKEQIVDLVGNYGMTVIRDMIPRAQQMQEIEEELRTARLRVETIMDRIEDLKK